MYLARVPRLVQSLFPAYTWRAEGASSVAAEPRVYLTFDDGPIPEVTPWVLDQLAGFQARATFFCVGENAERHPDLLRRLRREGHAVGNHTHNHLSGWGTDTETYVANVERADRAVGSRLFRPPYGRLRPSQAEALRSRYRIVMWDVLSGDFDADLAPRKCVRNVLTNVRPGSIVVFHDSLKGERNLRYALPRVLETLTRRGYRFAALREPGACVGLAADATRDRMAA